MNARQLLAAAFAATMIVPACGPSQGGGPPPTLPPGGVAITARNLEFDTTQLVVPAGVRFGLLFENTEGVPHNVRIYAEGVSEPLFVGEVFSGPATRLYDVPPIPAGTYGFRCDVHPLMVGDVVAR
jgi:plastocyanin